MTSIRDLRPEYNVLEVVVNSAVDSETTQQVMLDTLAAIGETGVYRLLCDFAEAQQHATVPQIIELAKALAASEPAAWRQAILPPHDVNSVMAISTWEAACNNRGLAVKVFPDRDRDAALAWLLGADEP